MKLSVKSILGGAGLLEEMEITHPKSTYRAVAVTVFEKERNSWVMHYLNETTGKDIAMTFREEGDSFFWQVSRPGEPRQSKLGWFKDSGEKDWRRSQLVSEDGGKTWATIFVDFLSKKP